MISKRLSLKKLEHRRCKRLRYAVDLIDEQKSLGESGLLNLIIDRSDNLTHRVLRHCILFSAVILVLDKRKSNRTLSRVVRDRVCDKTNLALLRDLLHDLRFSDSRRSDQKHRSLANRRNRICPVLILRQVCLDCILDFLFCTFDIHDSSPPLPKTCFLSSKICSGSRISLIAHGGTEISTY